MDDKERLLHFQQHKSQFDQTERQGNEWNSFLKDKERDADRYGETRANLLNKVRQEELEARFLEENKGLEAQHQHQWDKFNETGIPDKEKESEKPETDIPDKEKVSDSFEKNRLDMLGKQIEPSIATGRQNENPLEITTSVYEKLLVNQSSKNQEQVEGRSEIEKVVLKGRFEGLKVEHLSYNYQTEKENSPSILNTISKRGFSNEWIQENLKEKITDFNKTSQLQHHLNPDIKMSLRDKQNFQSQQNSNVSQNEQEGKRTEKAAERVNAFNELKAKRQHEAERTKDRER